MALKVSRPIQILLLVIVIAGVAGIASMSMLGKSSPAASGPALTADQVRARAHHTTTTAVAAAPKTTPKTAPKTSATKPPVVAVKQPRDVKRRRPAATTAPNGLPVTLNAALRQHRIVVVSIFDPQDKTDAVSFAEARAGAGDAGVGFLGVSVLDDAVAGPLTAALPGGGLLPVPGLLIYRGPGVLIERVDGFQDRDGVAQIAVGAVTAPPLATTTATATAPAPAPAPAPVATP